jgi:hypothetical protein
MYHVQGIRGSRKFRVIADVGANVGQTTRDLVCHFRKTSSVLLRARRLTFGERK